MSILKFLVVLIVLFCSHLRCTESFANTLQNIQYTQVLGAEYNEADKTLSYGPEKLQFGKLWLANNSLENESKPLVIFIHGGCWLNAYSIEHSFALTSALADNGFMVWSLEYRRVGDEGGGWPGTFEDIQRGIQFILSQHKHLNFDPKRIYLLGHSAGGHLALLANDKVIAADVHKNYKIKVIGLAAITDIIQYSNGANSCQTAVSQFMGGQYEDTDTGKNKGIVMDYKHATPRNVAKVTLFHGEQDQIVPLSQSTDFSSEVVRIPGAGHFDFLHPKTKAFELLLEHIQQSGKTH
ncbi:alpha/beta hydrolase [Aliiglaciecola sp. 3_MG-2023]|uniref:alpha/beta hydrolase n=1 Tax=Aliiglaciecola sp. 3_MG-2023 TaxID=3062644 RepID=UPI0026E1D121|nr:alpha/beta hydrolase [Aliiglaciecola sp. 3_MG-2023]MDO6693405.1 alpha/beta hydrolase [Aliiglaciecola sp. 3_MG-2023]